MRVNSPLCHTQGGKNQIFTCASLICRGTIYRLSLLVLMLSLSFQPTAYCSGGKWDAPIEVFDAPNMQIQWGDLGEYELMEKAGSGKYSDVYDCEHRITKERYVCKILKNQNEYKTKRELRIMQQVQGGPAIVRLVDQAKGVANHWQRLKVALVLEKVENRGYKELYAELEDQDVRYYLYELLSALAHVHSLGIIHRDVKPNNCVYDPATRKFRLIDFGLSEWYVPGRRYSLSVASRWYKAPELLIGVHTYDYAMDIWAVGCTFAAMIFQFTPLFDGEDETDQIFRIVQVLGSTELYNWTTSAGIPVEPHFFQIFHPNDRPMRRRKWTEFLDKYNKRLALPDALDLLDNFLRYNPRERITAQRALEHHYFDPIRHMLPPRPSAAPPAERYIQQGYEDYIYATTPEPQLAGSRDDDGLPARAFDQGVPIEQDGVHAGMDTTGGSEVQASTSNGDGEGLEGDKFEADSEGGTHRRDSHVGGTSNGTGSKMRPRSSRAAGKRHKLHSTRQHFARIHDQGKGKVDLLGDNETDGRT